jgi:hypothetical protein
MNTARALLVAAGIAPAITGISCNDRELTRTELHQVRQTGKRLPVRPNRDIDILFVIDNSDSMAQEQQSLARNFQRFIEILERTEGGMPSVHLGVVSTDIGIDAEIEGCELPGDDGLLQTAPRLPGCIAPADPYIADVAIAPGERHRNYTGSLADAFSCIAQLGTGGCGFEHPLEAMRRALEGSRMASTGFLRPHAYLAVIIVSDEDDCSAAGRALFSSDTSTLGPLSSFRCFAQGIRCEPDDPSIPGERRNCELRRDSPYLEPVQTYVDFLRGLKPDPSLVIAAGIVGNATPVAVTRNDRDEPVLAPSCQSAAGKAAPALRLQAFFSAFPQRSRVTTICNEDLGGPLTEIADLLRVVPGHPCLDEPLADVNPAPGLQPDCAVSDIVNPGPAQQESLVPRCADPMSPGTAQHIPCWYIEADPVLCASAPGQLKIAVERGGVEPPLGTYTDVRCLLR